jgi:hypothetical protein
MRVKVNGTAYNADQVWSEGLQDTMRRIRRKGVQCNRIEVTDICGYNAIVGIRIPSDCIEIVEDMYYKSVWYSDDGTPIIPVYQVSEM